MSRPTRSPRPNQPLTLTVVGTRRPPFLYLLDGEAVFLGEYTPRMSCEIGVFTIEAGEPSSRPTLSTDLAFLNLVPVGVETKPHIESGTFVHRWRYRVEFKNRPPSGSFMGLLTAQSPWIRRRRFR